MNYRRIVVAAVLGVLLVFAGGLAWSGLLMRQPQAPTAHIAAAAAVPADGAGYARAEAPRPLTFPADFGPHNDFQTEWWYYTGNLDAATGEHFGYQLTIFRRAVVPPAQREARASDWGVTQVYMAHLALTDVSGKRHDSFEKLGRGAAGLAGAQAQPYRVWLDDWSVADAGDGQLRLTAQDGDVSLKLDLREAKGPVLQGDRGYSQKGPEMGNASYYFSQTRLVTSGEITSSGRTFAVQGFSWMDHEYSTSALSEGQVGWDWFSLQLNDGRELMLFQIRRADGTMDAFSAGLLVERDGTTRRLSRQDFSIQVTNRWRSPLTNATYPAGWRLEVPSASLDLTITPYLADQEMNVSYSYWEGAVAAQGRAGGQAVTGNGYVELTGYAGSMRGQF